MNLEENWGAIVILLAIAAFYYRVSRDISDLRERLGDMQGDLRERIAKLEGLIEGYFQQQSREDRTSQVVDWRRRSQKERTHRG